MSKLCERTRCIIHIDATIPQRVDNRTSHLYLNLDSNTATHNHFSPRISLCPISFYTLHHVLRRPRIHPSSQTPLMRNNHHRAAQLARHRQRTLARAPKHNILRYKGRNSPAIGNERDQRHAGMRPQQQRPCLAGSLLFTMRV